MEITGKSVSFNIDSYVSNVKAKQKTEASPDATHEEKPRQDTVQLSARAKEIQEAKKSINAISDVRDEKVAEIKTQIENGTYQVDGERIAANVVEESITGNAALRVDLKA